MNPQRPASHRFGDSLSALARIAMKETASTGYGLFQRNEGASGFTNIATIGEHIQAWMLSPGCNAILTALPLHTDGEADGLVAFSFENVDSQYEAENRLRILAGAMEMIWAARHSDALYFNLAHRLSEVGSQLIDSKIVDRAEGLLATDQTIDQLNSLAVHVHNVFRPSPSVRALEKVLKELEDEIEERRVTRQAKAILQATQSLSEEEAYSHLRSISRKSRRRLKEVAADVMTRFAVEARSA